MTLKYESEILYGLMKRDGDDNPSDVLPYESELKEKYLNQVVGAYPKLQDYRPEWLNYNLYKYLPADFPVESVTNVTNASFQNVVPYAYKSAILKGQTLVNLVDSSKNYSMSCNSDDSSIYTINEVNNSSINITQSALNTSWRYIYTNINLSLLKANTKYLIVGDNMSNISSVRISSGGGTNTLAGSSTIINNKYAILTTNDLSTLNNGQILYMSISNITTYPSTISISNVRMLEYVEGMENWDIPYFTGMQSVKMPVLTTIGENVLNPKKFVGWNGSLESNDGVIINVIKQTNDQNMRVVYENMNLPLNTYTITAETVNGNYLGGNLRVYDDKNKCIYEFSINSGKASATISSRISQLKMWNPHGVDCQIRITITTNGSTTYEPYKSNILTVNEDVELGSVGEVKDDLNLLTGQLTQRTETRAYQEGDEANSEVITDMANTRYKLPKESIKTVDLTCINEQCETVDFMPLEGTMNVHTSSDTIHPLLDMEVPVEAITQNLNSFASMEE